MLPWQQSMLDQWDHYSVDEPAALKRKALVMALGIYALVCLLFFIPHLQHAQPATVFIHGATAPVLFMGNGKGGGNANTLGSSARLRRAKKLEAQKIAAQKKYEATQKKLQKKEVTPKPEPKKAELPARNSVVKQPKQKSKKELLAEKKKAQAEAAKAKKAASAKMEAAKKAEAVKLQAAKAAAEKAAKEKIAAEKKLKDQKLKENSASAKKNEPKVPEKIEVKEPPQEQVTNVTDAAVEDELQEVAIGQDFGDGTGEGSGQGYEAALKSHMALGRAITRVWRPPQVKITAPVRVVAQVDAAGKVTDAQLESKSGIVAYDIAARAAVLRAEFPKEFWGKPVALVFGA